MREGFEIGDDGLRPDVPGRVDPKACGQLGRGIGAGDGVKAPVGLENDVLDFFLPGRQVEANGIAALAGVFAETVGVGDGLTPFGALEHSGVGS